MDIHTPSMDWSRVQVFLAIAEQGSLSAAAKTLGVTQPTVGRQLAALEAQLDLSLFERRARGMEPTQAGLSLLDHARTMRAAANALSLEATGAAQTAQATVRITASVFLAHYALPAIIAKARAQHPEISIELAPSDTTENLLFREADIAIRMVRPAQLGLIAQQIGQIEIGLFATPGYLSGRAPITDPDDLLSHDFVGYDRNDLILQGFEQAGLTVDRGFFAVRCDNQSTYWELVRQGCGLGFGQAWLGRQDTGLQEVPLPFDLPTLPVWLVRPEQLRDAPAVRRIWALLSEELRKIAGPAPAT